METTETTYKVEPELRVWLRGAVGILGAASRLSRAPRLGAAGEMALLCVIGENPGITQVRLRQWIVQVMELDFSTASLSLMVERMRKAGLVLFGGDDGDRRRKGLVLSDRGWMTLHDWWWSAGALPMAVPAATVAETVVPSVLMGRLMDSAVDLFDGRVVGWVAKEPEIAMLAVLVELGMVTVDSVTGRIARVAGAVANDGTGEEADL